MLEAIKHARNRCSTTTREDRLKKDINNAFDVTMGSYDGAEICELIGLYILSTLQSKLHIENVGFYRDDGLAVLRSLSGRQADRVRKQLTEIFGNFGLRITVETNLKAVNYLDVNLNLNTGKYKPYRKPNNEPTYINAQSNHPPSITKQIPTSISKRISSLSSDKDTFDQAAPLYREALKRSGYAEPINFTPTETTRTKPPNRGRKIIWFNPPFSKAVKTNIGATFLRLIQKHFPPTHKLRKIFNRNTLKISYSCTKNINQSLDHTTARLSATKNQTQVKEMQLQGQAGLPLGGKCLTEAVIYRADVTSEANKRLTLDYQGGRSN
ncbi:hypothetical protein BSL78_00459 [Apostichopus japonicus]|uniref:Helix-turn-helix domain-containing protein n=1 Tax=Stichopus japonicus TaxID=307972 RepID=A0A2G8LQN5_STIJA|nr:hypothetical protein BSL78_00459 [Apostichopus japonicus]